MKSQLTKENTDLKQKLLKVNSNNTNSNNNFKIFNNQSFQIKSFISKEKDNKKYIELENYFSSVWCMLKLNSINYIENGKNLKLNLIAIGFSGGRIYLINSSTMEIHQLINETSTIYSLCQFNNNPKYLICSLSTGFISIYILKDKYYEIIQTIRKPPEIEKGEINKVITLSNGDLASADRGSITIWKQKTDEKYNKIEEFELYKEIITDNDACQLIEVNPNIFACAIYKDESIKIFNNNGNDYPLLGIISNVESHGDNSNGMAKIDDKLFCLGGINCTFYLVCVEPVQLIQKIQLYNENSLNYVSSLCMSNKGLLFVSYDDKIVQFKIINDENNNFIEFKEFDIINNKQNSSEAIVETEDGKIFYQLKTDKTIFCLYPFKFDKNFVNKIDNQ